MHSSGFPLNNQMFTGGFTKKDKNTNDLFFNNFKKLFWSFKSIVSNQLFVSIAKHTLPVWKHFVILVTNCDFWYNSF